MKCNKCEENEAVFYYSSNINGDRRETYLCADCARELGFGELLDYSPAGMLDRALSAPFGGMLDRALSAPFGGLFDGFFPHLAGPAVLMTPARERTCQSGLCGCGEAQEEKIPCDAGEDVKKRRELAALKNRLDSAVKAENYEEAIELRDKIRQLEK